MSIAKMTAFANTIIKGNTGYDQSQRFSFFDRATQTFIPNREADCSAMCGAIATRITPNVDLYGTFYTGNMRQKLGAVGWTAIKFTSFDQLREGDLILAEQYHVEYIGPNRTMGSAVVDERGKYVGGKAGNQTGRETRWTGFYQYPYGGGWQWILRPPKTTTKKGFLMALTDKQQASLYRWMQSSHDILTGYAPNKYVKKGYSLPLIVRLVRDNVGVGAGSRARIIQDLVTGGGPRGQDKSLLRDILANQKEILNRLDALETKETK